jgi:hypothetical protein
MLAGAAALIGCRERFICSTARAPLPDVDGIVVV